MKANQNSLYEGLEPPRIGDGRRKRHLILPRLLAQAAGQFLLADEDQNRAREILTKWAQLESSGKLAKMKETALQGEFIADVFGTALGYARFSENLTHWDIEEHYPLPDGQEADAAIGSFSAQERRPPIAVIELKGPAVNVDRKGSSGRTPVQQCWDYLNAVPQCPWGILCNCVSFRLYHRDHTPQAYELFTLQELRDEKMFREFYTLFQRAGLLQSALGQMPRAAALLGQTQDRQREVGRELYADYHDSRVDLIRHLRLAPHCKTLDPAIRIAQTLLDRIIFIAFCEDRDLLPPDSIGKTWRDISAFTLATNPRWQNFLSLFRSIDQGNERFEIPPFDGGLFAHDDEVDSLQLEDRWTNFFKRIGSYDFRDEVNVDVLGHIFEHSITDLEALRADPDALAAEPTRKVTGQRKREGVYYTPRRITRWIVEHTLGPCIQDLYNRLAEERRIDPEIEPSDKDLPRWLEFQRAKLKALGKLRVCDPACGSGAFLIQAFDFLEEAYDEVISSLAQYGEADFARLRSQARQTILAENLHGVDLSPEAVEIAKLALWIRTAEKGKSLADLSQSILCGNSIVDDPQVDPKAMDWQARFPSVFAEGGFDCVIGNPPYVKLQNFRKRQPEVAAYLVKRYRSAQTGNFDMYLPFIERGLELLKPSGRLGFIAPNVWLYNEYGRGLRELVLEKKALERFVDFRSFQVFPDGTTYTALQFLSARPREAVEVTNAPDGELNGREPYRVTYQRLGSGAWAFVPDAAQRVLDKMRQTSTTLGEATQQVFQGLITSADAVYHLIKLGPGRYYSRALNRMVGLEDEIMKPLISGKEAVPFACPPTDKYLLFPYSVASEGSRLHSAQEMSRQFRRAWAYLQESSAGLRARERGRFDDEQWWRFGRHQSIDKQDLPKLLVPRLLLHLFASLDAKGAVAIDNVDVGGVIAADGYNLHYLLAVLNSRACDFAWRLTSKPFRGEYRSANKQFISPLPIPRAEDQKPVAKLARELARLHGLRLEALANVRRRFVVDLPRPELLKASPLPPKLPRKLAEFTEVPIAEVLKEMARFAGRKLRPEERSQWDTYLTREANAIAKLDGQIENLTAELNDRVYALYGLDRDDIRIIEEAVSGEARAS